LGFSFRGGIEMKCTQCGGAMKPLFTTWFCPRDCDRPRQAKAAEDWSWVDKVPSSRRGRAPDFTFQWGTQTWAAWYGTADAQPGERGWSDPHKRWTTAAALIKDFLRMGRRPDKVGDEGLPGWGITWGRECGADEWVLTKING
jgi:hypothetical protein